ncbi:NTP-binding protein [Corynebacterium lizhenjunii]|uniref:NTP-binding protein n=1 Tax=Corynebacterium lizhenjunii TaxID=2709394 RepID=A0A7T0KFX3_9CORY|nr:phage/plasmid primase, P4 family [Corynebacterium lizhenjunii]QPK79264.1 NTP-binding protein [Corynebacterium lizhenjunii]
MSDNVSFSAEVFELPTVEQRVIAGDVDTTGGEVELPGPGKPYEVAKHVMSNLYSGPSGRAQLLYWRGNWWEYTGVCWEQFAEQGKDADLPIQSDLYPLFASAVYRKVSKDVDTLVPWDPTSAKVGDVIRSLKARANKVLDDKASAPAYIGGTPGLPGDAGEYVALRNGLFRLSTRELVDHTPALFTTYSLPFDYDPGARCDEWLAFIYDTFAHDRKGAELLQEFMGYVIAGRTDLHKALLMVGPTRAGKGVILRVMTELVGQANTGSTSLDGLGTDPGQAALIGKPLATVGDAREPSRSNGRKATEFILNVVGGDSVSIQRKYQPNWTGKLPTRFVIASNELPRFVDAAGAVANRFMAVRLVKSHLGKEDPGLEGRLLAELPGIFNWALQGLDRLNETGRFTVPDTMADMVDGLEGLASPAKRFLQDMLEVTGNPNDIVPRSAVHRAWKTWHDDNGTRAASAEQMVNQLSAVDSRVECKQLPVPGAVPPPGGGRVKRDRYLVGVKLVTSNIF